jgi:spore germination protein
MKKIFITFLLAAPLTTFAFSYGGWIPYWNRTLGTNDVVTRFNIKPFAEIDPFSYEVKQDGTLIDKIKLADAPWPDFLAQARKMKMKIVPSVALFDADQIHYLVSNTKRRQAHEDIIANMVIANNFDGVDIDYEQKDSADKGYFSTFIYGLYLRLHPKGKILSCTIEPRTPLASLYEEWQEVPKTVDRSNDLAKLNKYCDEIKVMAYDQGFVDKKLNKAKGSDRFYAPVADPDWVKKVLQETLKEVSAKKLVLGIPTYGYEYEVILGGEKPIYKRVRSIGYQDAMALASSTNAILTRNSAGELSFTYNIIGNSARLVWFSDAQSAADKIKLAKNMGLRGVFFFKFDGELDPATWSKMK